MEIKEKIFIKIYKDNKIFYCYGPDLSTNKIDNIWTSGEYCWLLRKPIEEAGESDVIECLDPIKVWFSDFQIYKWILKKIYKPETYCMLCEKRWEFLNSNKNRFQLIYTLIGDYRLAYDEFELVCYDTVDSSYISLVINDYPQNNFIIRKLKTEETCKEKIVEKIFNSDVVEINDYNTSRVGISYNLEHKEYEPLFNFFKFVHSFYFYYIIDGYFTSWFEPIISNG